MSSSGMKITKRNYFNSHITKEQHVLTKVLHFHFIEEQVLRNDAAMYS